MGKSRYRLAGLVVVLALLGVVAGCSGITAPSRFYLLTPMPDAPKNAAVDDYVGVYPVRLPEYLDQPLMVTRVGTNELRMGEFDRWAEPLKENFTRVLIENLSMLLGADKVLRLPLSVAQPVRQSVFVEVFQFDATSAGEVVLSAKWALFDNHVKAPILSKTALFTERPGDAGYGAAVAAGSRALGKLSLEISESIREEAGKKSR